MPNTNYSTWKFCFLLTICLAFGAKGATLYAQPPRDIADTESVHSEQLWERYRIEQQIQQSLASPLHSIITSPQPPVADPSDKSTQAIFKLNDVVFEPMPKSISHAELQAVASRYTAMERVSLADIYRMLVEIDHLFDARNVVGRAVLPIQDVEDGVLHVQIIESTVDSMVIDLKRQKYPLLEKHLPDLVPACDIFDKSFFKKQFRYPTRGVLNTRKLEDELLRYNRTFSSQVLAEIEPGHSQGTSRLKLTLIKPQPVSAAFFVDNSGRESSGKIRSGVFTDFQDVLGLNESFFIYYDETEGTSMFMMSGSLPITRWGTFLEMFYDYGTPETLYGPFADLGIHGVSERYRPGFRQILHNSKKIRWDAFLHVDSYRSTSWFQNFVNYEEKLTSITIGNEFTRRYTRSTLFGSLAITTGNVDTAGYTGEFVNNDFCLLRAGLMYVRNPNPKWTLIARGNGQAAFTNLPSSQVFQIGGMATVRGTEEALMSGESGYLMSLEARRLVWNNDAPAYKMTRVEAFGFFDHGGVFYQDYPLELHPSDFLFSIGVGGMLSLGKYLSATVGVGQPLFTDESHQEAYRSSLRHARGYFTVRAQF